MLDMLFEWSKCDDFVSHRMRVSYWRGLAGCGSYMRLLSGGCDCYMLSSGHDFFVFCIELL